MAQAGFGPPVDVRNLVLHTPVMFGSVADLLFVEERDERVLPAVALTRTSIQTLLVYRLGAAAGLRFVALLMAFPARGRGTEPVRQGSSRRPHRSRRSPRCR